MKKSKKIIIVGTSPEHEYGWKDDKEPQPGSKEHIENWKKQQKEKIENTKTIAEALHLKNSVDKDETVLSFDGDSGMLIVSPKKNENSNNIVVDQIYRDGFFNCN